MNREIAKRSNENAAIPEQTITSPSSHLREMQGRRLHTLRPGPAALQELQRAGEEVAGMTAPDPWPVGDSAIAQVARLVATGLPGCCWNKGVAATVDWFWAWNDPGVRAAYAVQDPDALLIALLNASMRLPLRQRGRAVLLLVIALTNASEKRWRAVEVFKVARNVGISRRSMQRAKRDLRLRSERCGGLGARGRWYWTAKDAKKTGAVKRLMRQDDERDDDGDAGF